MKSIDAMTATSLQSQHHLDNRKRISVLIIAPQPFYEDRGTPIAIRQVITALSGMDFKVDLLTYPIGTELNWPNVSIIRSVNPFRIRSVKIGFSVKKVILDTFLCLSFMRLLSRRKYDLIHAVEEMSLPVVLLSRFHKTRVMYDMQSSLPVQLSSHFFFGSALVQRVMRRVEKYTLAKADLISCSAGMKNYIRSIDPLARVYEWGYIAENIDDTLDPDLPAQLRADLNISTHQPVVLYAGNFETYQGLDLLVSSISETLQAITDVTFVLVGKSPKEIPVWFSETQHLRESGHLVVVDRQIENAVLGYLRMADILVSPRKYGDNIPLKIFTYMAARRAIVATDITAHRALLGNDRGLLVEQTPSAMAAGIIGLLQQPDRRASIEAAAYDFVSVHHTNAAFARRLDEQYKRSMGKGRGSRKYQSNTANAADGC